ncbi:MAG: hypothetical protein KC420_06030, partial [Myxococcales bacterium]|nr:hypothetical protein [Myxococcales bacterium]
MSDRRSPHLHAMAADDPRFHGVGALVLADGRVFRGLGFGARTTVVGEVVFNTSLTGYQEILSDPSYRGQLVCLTSTEIGNVGANPDDDESRGFGAEGLLCRALSPVVSNYRAERSLPEYLRARGIPGLAELDTRALTRRLREGGSCMAALSSEHDDVDALLALARGAAPIEGRDLASEVSAREPYTWEAASWPIPGRRPARAAGDRRPRRRRRLRGQAQHPPPPPRRGRAGDRGPRHLVGRGDPRAAARRRAPQQRPRRSGGARGADRRDPGAPRAGAAAADPRDLPRPPAPLPRPR